MASRSVDPIRVERYAHAQAFLDSASPFLAEREAEHNLILGIAATLLVDPARMGRDVYLAATRRGSSIVAAAVMTPPFNIVVSCTDDDEALGVLTRDLDRVDLPVPGITAPVEVARSFIDLWVPTRDVVARKTMGERIYRVERVISPTGVPGHARIATADDRATLVDFVWAFLQEALGRTDDREALALVDGALRTGSRIFYLWDHDGPVSVAGVTGPTPNGIRIGPVYTPPALRRHGYASAVTAAASQAQLDLGRRFVFLFTDLANVTSNKIYQQIGYEPVIDIDQWTFEAPEPGRSSR